MFFREGSAIASKPSRRRAAPGRRHWCHTSTSQNVAKQVQMAPMTLEQLHKVGVTSATKLKLEFFFYTDTKAKAAALSALLKDRGYDAEHRAAASGIDPFVVTGWTDAMVMSDDIVSEWTREMYEAGFRYDCEFDGWGTTPSQ